MLKVSVFTMILLSRTLFIVSKFFKGSAKKCIDNPDLGKKFAKPGIFIYQKCLNSKKN